MTLATRAKLTVADIEDAHRLLRGVSRITPVESCRVLSDKLAVPVFLKCENLQRTGSFKLRGAYVRLARLAPEIRALGVVAASAGNHAQGVALAAQLLGAQATVFMPRAAPLPKMQATRGYGAEVRLVEGTVDACLEAAQAEATRSGRTMIHPFDHSDIIAGQATVGLELLEQLPATTTVVVPVGGGGLISGVAAAVKTVRPDIRVVGVQAQLAAAFPASLAAGRPLSCAPGSTMADGIAVGRPGELTLQHVQDTVDDIVTVTEDAIARAVLLCLERTKLVVEPAGAVGVAALLDGLIVPRGVVAVILSGGNIDPLLTMRVLRHGLGAAGRHLAVRLRIRDRPGQLAAVLTTLADMRVNVLDVEQVRLGGNHALDEVEVTLQLETGGPDHCEETLHALRHVGGSLVAV
jgi:threonine dehydratase